MAYTYSPYKYEAGPARPRYDSYAGEWQTPSGKRTNQTAAQWDIEEANRQRSQFQDYSADQFKGLFDMVNVPQKNPLEGFSNAPIYSPLNRTNYESDNAFQDARFGNINNYLSSLGSFLGNMGGGDAGIAQAAAQRAAHRVSMPTIGMSQPMGMPQMGSNPASPGLSGFGGGAGRLVGKGWGSHPAFKGLLSGGGE